MLRIIKKIFDLPCLHNLYVNIDYQKEVEILDSRLRKSSNRYSNWEQHKKSKEMCIHCSSTNFEGNINRIKGEINGHSSGSYGIFGGSSYGSIRGEIDTYESFKCLDCKRAWNVVPLLSVSGEKCFIYALGNMQTVSEREHKLSKIDKKNPDAKNLLSEEKGYIERHAKSAKEIFGGLHIFTLAWAKKNKYFYENPYYINFDKDTFDMCGVKTDFSCTKCGDTVRLLNEYDIMNKKVDVPV
jgi:hypothetical protein